MKTTIRTADGVREIPSWATCYCVTRHTPKYIHPYPFVLPNGVEMWLCPNSHHQASTLLSLYNKHDGPPVRKIHEEFNYFVRELLKYYWQLELRKRADEQSHREWAEKERQDVLKKIEKYGESPELYEMLKRLDF